MANASAKVGAPPKGAGGLLSRSPDGKLALYVNIMYKGTDINGGKPQQLIIGASGLQVLIGNTNARALGIPMSICSQNEDTHKGRFVRTLHGFNSAGKEIKLATITRVKKGSKAVVTPTDDEYLKANIDRLGFKLSGKGLAVTQEVTAEMVREARLKGTSLKEKGEVTAAMVEAKKEALKEKAHASLVKDVIELKAIVLKGTPEKKRKSRLESMTTHFEGCIQAKVYHM